MSDPQPGDFGLVKMGGDVGKLIRLGQALNGTGFADYEHAFIYIGGGQLVEAEPGGARRSPATEYSGVLWSTGIVALTDAQRAAICTAARCYVGTPYSFADYAALAAHRLHIPAAGLKARIADSGHLICSQLVDQCYTDAGVHLFRDGRWPGYVTPGDLYDRLTGAL